MSRKGTRGIIEPNVMRKRDEISAQYVVEFLNELVRLDKYAMTDMMSERILVNKELQGHPTIQTKEFIKGVREIGLMSIINGLFGLEGEEVAIEVVTDKHTDVIVEFRLTEPWRGWIEPFRRPPAA